MIISLPCFFSSIILSYLFADLFYLVFHFQRNVGQVEVGRFAAYGVGLSVELLHQKIQLAPHGPVRMKYLSGVGDVAVQTSDLLVDTGFVGKQTHFVGQLAFVQLDISQRLGKTCLQSGAILLGHLGGKALRTGKQGLHDVYLGQQVLLQSVALCLPHGVEVVHRTLHGLRHHFSQNGVVLIHLLQRQHVTGTHKGADVEIVMQLRKGLTETVRRIDILLRKGCVHDDTLVRIAHTGVVEKHVHMPPRQPLGQNVANDVLAGNERAGDLGGNVQKTVVDGFELHRELSVVSQDGGLAVTCHTFHDLRSDISQ